ncbi:MAG TPA: hypothetical protein QGG47_16200 [Acidobacteriota bacterium]|nr:hypothetical protein [Acidobacteriota bacterium]
MPTEISLREIEQSAFREVQQDGLLEILVSLILFLASGSVMGQAWLLIAIGVVVVFQATILEGLRRRITYPRIGYAKLAEDPPGETFKGMFIFVAAAIATIAAGLFLFGELFNIELWIRWLPAFAGLMMAGAFLFLHRKSGRSPHLLLAILAPAGGLAFSLLRIGSRYENVGLFCLYLGGVLLIMGLAQLTWFLLTHPRAELEADHAD